MMLIERVWHCLLADPFTWLFYYFFQPAKFRREFEREDFAQRTLLMLRLALPIFLVSYPLSFFSSWWAILLGTVGGIVWGIVSGIRWGIVGGIGLSVGLGLGLGPDVFTSFNLGIVLLGFGGGLGIGLGIIGDILGDTARGFLGGIKGGTLGILNEIGNWIGMGFLGGTLGAIIGGLVRSVTESVTGGLAVGIIVGILMGVLPVDSQKDTTGSTSKNTLNRFVRRIWRHVVWGIVGGCIGSITGTISWNLLGSDPRLITFTIEWQRSLKSPSSTPPSLNTLLGIILGSIMGVVIGIVLGIMKSFLTYNPTDKVGKKLKEGRDKRIGRGIDECIVLGSAWGILVTLVSAVTFDPLTSIFNGIGAAIFFSIYYLFGYYRPPLYLASSISTLRARVASKKNPSEVFRYLHRCALYWNESMNLPLPFLKNILLIAIGQNIDQVMEEITFIKTKRPPQIGTVRVSLIEIIMQDLEKRKTLRDLAEASEQLTKFLQQGKGVLDPKWEAHFTHLYNASLDAIRYLTSLRWRARYDALTNMIANLEIIADAIKKDTTKKGSATKATSKPLSLEGKHKQRLNVKIDKWLGTVEGELDKLNQEPEKTDLIINPYIVGPVLDQLGTPLFVGRRDLARQLEQALRRGSQRPTFFLNGERRMGKSSTLKQLPYLLDARYFLPIFYDLQAPEISSSTAAFLGTVAEKICEAVSHKIQLEGLEKRSLQEASWKSEAEIYFVFDEWLKKVEHLLEQKDWTLLLSFDEFEHLEKVAQAKDLDVNLLLRWFRSVIQNRSRLALLFSGGRSAGEMSTEAGINWASYFVNVQTLRVSFLRETEARQLITQPIPDYPIEQIFGEGVVDEIIHVTGCHPFLVQAVCSALIDNLNADKRERAVVHDVAIAMDQVVENWEAYFQDLWNRTDQNQRLCLFAIGNLGKGDLQKIAQQSGLNERIVRRTLEALRKRDLVLQEDENYGIAAPIFAKWVEYNYWPTSS